MPTPTQADRRALVRRKSLCLLVLLLALFVHGVSRADRVELKTGEVFFGKILRADRREVSMRLESGGILSFRMNQVAFFRKNFVLSDEWVHNPILEVDDPTLDALVREPADDNSFQGSPPTPGLDATGGITFDPLETVDDALVRATVEDRRGFRVSPPRGFLNWDKPDGASVRRFYDPVTQGSLDIVDLGATEEALEAVKTKVTRVHARNAASGLKVLQDDKVVDAPYEGWYFEFQEDIDGSKAFRRLWLFARGSGRVLLLKYSCPEEHYDEISRSFTESLRSFSLTDAAPPVEPQDTAPPTKGPQNLPPRVSPAEELLRLLNSNRDQKTSKKTIDEFLKREQSGSP